MKTIRYIFSYDVGLKTAYNKIGNNKILATMIDYPFMIVLTQAEIQRGNEL